MLLLLEPNLMPCVSIDVSQCHQKMLDQISEGIKEGIRIHLAARLQLHTLTLSDDFSCGFVCLRMMNPF